MSNDEEDLSAEPLQLQPYAVDAGWVHSATAWSAETHRKIKRFDKKNRTTHIGIMMNLEMFFKIIQAK